MCQYHLDGKNILVKEGKMVIRLDPDTQDLTVRVVIPKELRPYFTEWYMKEKKANETPDQFALRQLKEQAIHDRVNRVFQEQQESLGVELEAINSEM